MVSWYPPHTADENGIPSDAIIPTLLDEADKYDLKIAFHIEPYSGRSPSNLRDNLQYIHDTYSNHPAFYRTKKGNANFPNNFRS